MLTPDQFAAYVTPVVLAIAAAIYKFDTRQLETRLAVGSEKRAVVTREITASATKRQDEELAAIRELLNGNIAAMKLVIADQAALIVNLTSDPSAKLLAEHLAEMRQKDYELHMANFMRDMCTKVECKLRKRPTMLTKSEKASISKTEST